MLKAVLILDAGRRCRQMEGKMKKMQLSGQKVSKKKLGKLKSEIDNLNAIKITVCLSSSIKFRKYTFLKT